jgi:Ca2+-binding EF-hand superfamily protein
MEVPMQRAIPTLLGVATLCFAAAGAQAMSHEGDGDKNKEMWSNLDADGNGSVSRQEYTDALSKHFERADTDSDGQISQEEWQARKEAMRSQMHKDGTHAE